MILVTIIGSLMFVIENGNNGFIDIPTSIYWAVVTITTVGYGDISPVTPFRKIFIRHFNVMVIASLRFLQEL